MTDDLKGEMSKIEIIWIESEINSYLKLDKANKYAGNGTAGVNKTILERLGIVRQVYRSDTNIMSSFHKLVFNRVVKVILGLICHWFRQSVSQCFI